MASADDEGARAVLTRHAEAVATVRAFLVRSAAEHVVLLIDVGEEREAVMVEGTAGGRIELTDDGETRSIDPELPVPALARPLPDLRPAPASALSVDPESGELSAPLGAVANLADAVLALARAFGGRTVATAEFATRDPALPITIAAREGEPLLLAVGDARFVLPETGS